MVFTINGDVEDRGLYSCHNQTKRCISSWTYDDWHCNGCHWKGLGQKDIESDTSGQLEQEAQKIELRLSNSEDI